MVIQETVAMGGVPARGKVYGLGPSLRGFGTSIEVDVPPATSKCLCPLFTVLALVLGPRLAMDHTERIFLLLRFLCLK